MRVDFGPAALVIAALLLLPAAPGHAMTTTGTFDAAAVPPWIAVFEAHQATIPSYDSALLPPQFERVLMLDLDFRSDRSADAVIDALFAGRPAGGDGSQARSASPIRHPERIALFVLLAIGVGLAGRRLRRRRRLARSAGSG